MFAENTTIDSSEILGGEVGVLFEQELNRLRTLTIDASTIDAGTPGVSDPAPSADVEAIAATGPSRALVNIIGSILLEAQTATAAAKTEANIVCSYTNAPSQTQTAGGSNGAITCGAGEAGNTAAEAPAAVQRAADELPAEPGLGGDRQRSLERDRAARRGHAVEHRPARQPALGRHRAA